MADTAIDAGALDDLLEGRTARSEATAGVLALAELADAVRALEIPGPGPAATSRMRERFASEANRAARHGWLPWAAHGLSQRVAMAAAAVGLLGGATSYATGVSPVVAATATADFAASVVRNLDPRRDSGGSEPSVTPSPEARTPESSPQATPPPPSVTQSPPAAATPPAVLPSASATEDDDSSERSDNSGPGSNNSGSGSENSGSGSDDDETRTPEPGDDN